MIMLISNAECIRCKTDSGAKKLRRKKDVTERFLGCTFSNVPERITKIRWLHVHICADDILSIDIVVKQEDCTTQRERADQKPHS